MSLVAYSAEHDEKGFVSDPGTFEYCPLCVLVHKSVQELLEW